MMMMATLGCTCCTYILDRIQLESLNSIGCTGMMGVRLGTPLLRS